MNILVLNLNKDNLNRILSHINIRNVNINIYHNLDYCETEFMNSVKINFNKINLIK